MRIGRGGEKDGWSSAKEVVGGNWRGQQHIW